jgi:hypothetical protein
MSGTTTADAAAQAAGNEAPQVSDPPAGAAPSPEPPGFRSRGSARRRARFLRRARELGYRDLGGLVFNLHRFGQRNDALVLAKLTTLGHIDTELRALEETLHERRPVTVLREAGITACARCAAIHSSEDNFCPNCGLPVRRHVEVMADLRSGVPARATATPARPAPSPPEPTATPVPAQQPASAAPTPSSAPASRGAARTIEEDGPTEIIGPPAPGS